MSAKVKTMKPVIDFGECVRDSPKFRTELENQMVNVENLDAKLEKLLKASNAMLDAGKVFLNQQHLFYNSLAEVSVHFRNDMPVYTSFTKCSSGLLEIAKFQTTLLDQINRAICKNLKDFLLKDLRACKESRSYLEKLQADYDGALQKNSSVPKGKNAEAEEASQSLKTARVNFRSGAVDFCYQLTRFQQKKRYEILDNVFSVVNAHKTFFHQGSDYFKDTETVLKNLSNELNEMRSQDIRAVESLLDTRGIIIHQTPDFVSGSRNGCLMQGYLFRRGSSKTFKSWKRRWFELLDVGQLAYRKRSDDPKTILEEDLRICMVRPMTSECDRRFCFELISPSKTHILQADTDEAFQAWVEALQQAITRAIHNSHDERHDDNSPPLSKQNSSSDVSKISLEKTRFLENILSVAGNNYCCDCGSPDPEWASANLGITLCINCSGVHRSLGVHYSKVKSLKLDTWEDGLWSVMKELGNDLINQIYLAKADVVDELGIECATPDCSKDVRETWIKAKYVDKTFVSTKHLTRGASMYVKSIQADGTSSEDTGEEDQQTGARNSIFSTSDHSEPDLTEAIAKSLEEVHNKLLPCDLEPGSSSKNEITQKPDVNHSKVDDFNLLLFRAARDANIKVMCECLALGADKNWVNIDDEESTPLHQAVLSGSVAACEYLILNGARINSMDAKKRSPLWLATHKGQTGQVCLFLRSRADHSLTNIEGQSPLDVAESAMQADIVTLLRYAKVDEQNRFEETEADGTFQELIRDIAQKSKMTSFLGIDLSDVNNHSTIDGARASLAVDTVLNQDLSGTT